MDLTAQNDLSEDADRQAGAEIEITPEMVVAGAEVLATHSRMFESLEEIAAQTFVAMLGKSRSAKAKPLAFDILCV